MFLTIQELEKHIKIECNNNIFYDKFYEFESDKLGSNIFENDQSGDIYIISAVDPLRSLRSTSQPALINIFMIVSPTSVFKQLANIMD